MKWISLITGSICLFLAGLNIIHKHALLSALWAASGALHLSKFIIQKKIK